MSDSTDSYPEIGKPPAGYRLSVETNIPLCNGYTPANWQTWTPDEAGLPNHPCWFIAKVDAAGGKGTTVFDLSAVGAQNTSVSILLRFHKPDAVSLTLNGEPIDPSGSDNGGFIELLPLNGSDGSINVYIATVSAGSCSFDTQYADDPAIPQSFDDPLGDPDVPVPPPPYSGGTGDH